jgi:hypothetical protein
MRWRVGSGKMGSSMKSKSKLDAAAEKLVDLVEQHLAKLSPEESAARRQAFYGEVAKVRARAKSEASPRGSEGSPRIRRRA